MFVGVQRGLKKGKFGLTNLSAQSGDEATLRRKLDENGVCLIFREVGVSPGSGRETTSALQSQRHTTPDEGLTLRLLPRRHPKERKDGGPDRDRTGDLLNAIHGPEVRVERLIRPNR